MWICADLTISITWKGSKFTIIPHRNIFCNIQCMACTHTMCNMSFCPMYCICACLIISANTMITKYLDNMYFVVLYVITGHHIMLATATTKIKTCLDTYLFLAGLLQIVAISFLLRQCPQMVTLPQIVKSDMTFIFGWCHTLFFLHQMHSKVCVQHKTSKTQCPNIFHCGQHAAHAQKEGEE